MPLFLVSIYFKKSRVAREPMNSLAEMPVEWKEDSKLVCIQTASNTFYYRPYSCGPAAPGDALELSSRMESQHSQVCCHC